MKKSDPNIKRFIQHVEKECKKRGIKLILSKKNYVKSGGVKSNGYFDSNKKELAVATGLPFKSWFFTFVHEYGHMTQWVTNCKAWKDYCSTASDAENLFFLWEKHLIELTAKQLEASIMPSIMIERDCEIRVLGLIKKFKLPINAKTYARNANAYLIFWANTRFFRKWYKIGREPYRRKNILKTVPDTIKALSYYRYPRFLELYDQECFK